MTRQETRRDDAATALTNGSWKRFLEVYEIGPAIGSGTCSVVHKITKRSTGIEYAGKFTTQKEAYKELDAMQMLREAVDVRSRVDSSGNNDLILNYHDAVNDDDSGHYMCLVSDLMRGPSNLLDALHDRGSYSEEDTRSIMRQILEALADIHESGMVHRDIKLDNVLLPSAECHTSIKIADFGFAAPWSESEPKLKQRCGTPLFISPEQADLSSECEYDNKVDVWAAGVILFMLLSGYPPFWGRNVPDLLHSISKENPRFGDPAWELVSPEAKDLVLHMLAKEPSSRFSAEEALRHPWMLEW